MTAHTANTIPAGADRGRRAARAATALLAALLAGACTGREARQVETSPEHDTFLIYAGTYTRGESEGIYVLELDAAAGTLGPPRLAARTEQPSFLALHPGGRFLYAVNETRDFEGRPSGAVSAFAIDPATGALRFIDRVASGGADPCHITVDRGGVAALVANYTGGSIASIRIRDDGGLGETVSFIQHRGSSVVKSRQAGPHAHAVAFGPEGRFLAAADLGADRIFIYRFDRTSGALTPADPPSAAVAPGSGPRHLAFHPGGRFAYVINEIARSITAFRRDPATGALETLQTVSTVPAGFAKGSTAELVISPDGRFLYGSNRGHDSIAVFAIDQERGTLTPVEIEPTRGRTPRGFGIDPSGRWLVAANQESDSLVLFRIDPETGELEPTGEAARVPTPVCVVFLPARR